MIGLNLRALLARRKAGRCFCGRKRKGKGDTCARPQCLNRWRAAYGKDYRKVRKAHIEWLEKIAHTKPWVTEPQRAV